MSLAWILRHHENGNSRRNLGLSKLLSAHLRRYSEALGQWKRLLQLPSNFIFRMNILSLLVLETALNQLIVLTASRINDQPARATLLDCYPRCWIDLSSFWELCFSCPSAPTSDGVAALSQNELKFTWLACLPLLGLADSNFWSRHQPGFSAGLLTNQWQAASSRYPWKLKISWQVGNYFLYK